MEQLSLHATASEPMCSGVAPQQLEKPKTCCRVRESVQKKAETGTLQEQIILNEARRGSSQMSELLH